MWMANSDNMPIYCNQRYPLGDERDCKPENNETLQFNSINTFNDHAGSIGGEALIRSLMVRF